MAGLNDFDFRTVGVPQLNLNAAHTAASRKAVTSGISGIGDIFQGFADVNERNRQNQVDIDLSNLRKAADEHLGGPLAGETLEDYDAQINTFLENNQELTGSVGQRALNDFRNSFETKLTAERDASEQRDVTLAQRDRTTMLNERADREHQRVVDIRQAKVGARSHLAGFEANQEALTARLGDPNDVLTTAELASMNDTVSNNNLQKELEAAYPLLSQAEIREMVNFRIERTERLVQSPAARKAAADAARDEDRAYKATVARQAQLSKYNLKDYENLTSREHAYEGTNLTRANEELIKALTLKNGGDAPSDDILAEMGPILTKYVNQGVHAQDVVNALVTVTDAKDEILTFDFDESIDNPDSIPSLIRTSQLGQEHLARQKEYLKFNSSKPTAAAVATSDATAPAGGSDVASDVAPTDQPTADAAALSAEAAALEPGTNTSTLTPTEEREAVVLNVEPTKATTPAELKLVAINQLNKDELPVVLGNLEEALSNIPNALQSEPGEAETNTETRREIRTKIDAVEDRIGTLNAPVRAAPDPILQGGLNPDVRKLIEQLQAEQAVR